MPRPQSQLIRKISRSSQRHSAHNQQAQLRFQSQYSFIWLLKPSCYYTQIPVSFYYSSSSSHSPTMRPLTEAETKTLFTKLANYTGSSLNNLIAPQSSAEGGDFENERHVFRLHGSRVYYVRLSIANLATSIPRANLLSVGTCIGKFTKTGKFRLHITALDIIAPHARYKVWIKPNGEMPFLYGGNVVKAHVGRWSEDCPEHQGVVVMSMDDTPLVCRSFASGALCTNLTDALSGIRSNRPFYRRGTSVRSDRNYNI